jgi:hypothetical protein
MVRRRWPDVVIVIAILFVGTAGVWALWGDELRGTDKKSTAPTTTESVAPSN